MYKIEVYYENVDFKKMYNDLKEIGTDGSEGKRIFSWKNGNFVYTLEMFEEIFTEYVIYCEKKEVFRYMDIYNNCSIDSICTSVYLGGENKIIIKNTYIEFVGEHYDTVLTIKYVNG
jgi:hypothetical protein